MTCPGAIGYGPVKRRPDIRVFRLQAVQPVDLLSGVCNAPYLLGLCEVIFSVALLEFPGLAALDEALPGIFSYRFQHQKPWHTSSTRFSLHEALIHEPPQRGTRVPPLLTVEGTDSIHGNEGAPSDKDRN